MAYNSLPYTCPECGANCGVKHLREKPGPVYRRLRQCDGCGVKFYTLDLGNGEILDCWHVEGQLRNSIAYREKVLTYKRIERSLRKLLPGAMTEIAITHIRQRFGIPTPLKARHRQD